MVEAIFKETLPEGLYLLTVFGEKYAIQFDPKKVGSQALANRNAVDYYYWLEPDAGFSFDQWDRATNRGMFAENKKDGYFVGGQKIFPAAKLDGEVENWRRRFDQAFKEDKLVECKSIADRLEAFDATGRPLNKLVREKVVSTVTEEVNKDPLVGGVLAYRFKAIFPDEPVLATAYASAQKKLADQNEAIRLKAAAALSALTNKTATVHSLKYITQLPEDAQWFSKEKKQLDGTLDIGRAHVTDYWVDSSGDPVTTFNWLFEFEGQEMKSREFTHQIAMDKKITAWRLWFQQGSRERSTFTFTSKKEMDKFAQVLKSAYEKFRSDDQAKQIITSGNLTTELNDDIISFKIQVLPVVWSPLVPVPGSTKFLKASFDGRSTDVDIRTADGSLHEGIPNAPFQVRSRTSMTATLVVKAVLE